MVGGPSAEPKDESSDDDYAGIRGFVGPSDGKAFPIRVQSSSWKNASGSEKQEWWDVVEKKKPQHLELDLKVLPDNEWKMERRRSKELKAAKERERERAAAWQAEKTGESEIINLLTEALGKAQVAYTSTRHHFSLHRTMYAPPFVYAGLRRAARGDDALRRQAGTRREAGQGGRLLRWPVPRLVLP